MHPTMPPAILQPIVGAPKEGPSSAGYHKIVSFLRCQQEYKYSEVLKLERRDKEDKMALQVGVLTHVGRAAWFASQFTKNVEDVQKSIHEHVMASPSRFKADAEREACRLLAAYVEFWRSKPLPLCRAVEYDVGPAPLWYGDPKHMHRTARFDDISNYPEALNKLFIGDLKTTSDGIAGCVNEYRQHGQFILYNLLYKLALDGKAVFGPANGVMIDIITKEQVPKFHREPITITAFQEHWFLAALRSALAAAGKVTSTTPVHRNVTQCCRSASRHGTYMCDFHDLCHFGASRLSLYKTKSGESISKELIEL